MTLMPFLPITVILLSIILFLVLLISVRNRKNIVFRNIPAFRVLNQIIGKSVEEGKPIHISVGIGNLTGRHCTSGFAGLATLENLSRISLIGDRSAICTSGDGGLLILSQDVLRQVYRQAFRFGLFQEQQVRFSGVTPAAYITGTLTAMLDDPIAGSLLIGNFDSLAVLLSTQPFSNYATLAAADTLQAQAALYACSDESLLGEEIYAAGAYSGPNKSRTASLILQDILRWLVIGFIPILIILKLIGVI
jgi:hypothetical protein